METLRGRVAEGRARSTSDSAWRIEALSAQVIPLADACAFLERSADDILAPRCPGSDGRPGWLAGVDLEVHRKPHGVVLVVAPSNYPLFLPGVQVIQALVAGNAVLLKPGTGGTAAAHWFAARLREGGVPEHVLSVLDEAPDAARAAMAAGVDKVCLTGSAETGEAVLRDLAPSLTPATLELSGNDALLALEGADAETVADAIAFGLRLNASATCIAPRRALVHRSLLPAVAARLARHLGGCGSASIRVDEAGDGEPEDDGPEWERARRLVQDALATGGRLLNPAAVDVAAEDPADLPGSGAPGQAPVMGRDATGEKPTTLKAPSWVVMDASADADLRSVAVFAPILLLDAVANADEAVRRANDSPYALGASVFGPPEAARAVASRLNAGVVTINDVIVPTADPRLPFGGRGRSGSGVTRGAEGLLAMTVPWPVTERRLPGRFARRFSRPHRHFDSPVVEDEALFTAWLAVAHGRSLVARLRRLPGLVRALVARGRVDAEANAAPRPDQSARSGSSSSASLPADPAVRDAESATPPFASSHPSKLRQESP